MFENLILGINHYIEVYGQDPLFWLSWGFFLYFCSVFVYTILRKLFTKKTKSQEALKGTPTEPIVSLSELKPKRSKTDDIDYGRLSGEDVIATKLDLAHAYIEMNDHDHAKEVLESVIAEGNDTQKAEAKDLLKNI